MEKKLTEQEIRQEAKKRAKEQNRRLSETRLKVMRENNQNLPWEVLTWQEHTANDVLAIAIAIQKCGAANHNVQIGIDAAVQAAAVASTGEASMNYRVQERIHGEPVSGVLDKAISDSAQKDRDLEKD